MRDIDIVLKKRDVVRPSLAMVEPQSEPKKKTALQLKSWISWMLRTSSQLSFSVLTVFTPKETPLVVTPAKSSPATLATQTKGPKPAKPHLSKRLRAHLKTERLRPAVKRIGHVLKSPHGLVAVGQSVAILALFILVISYQRASKASLAPADSQASNSQTHILRQFLPEAPVATSDIQSFQAEQAASSVDLPLHAWVTPWNSASLASQASSYHTISAFWLTLNSDGIGLTPKADWSLWDSFKTGSKLNGQKLYLTVSADPNYSYLTLSSPSRQEQNIALLLSLVKEHGFDGIDIDYEGLGSENRALFTAYISNLATAFHLEHKLVAVTVEARIANQVPMDWKSLSDLADQVRIMAYDYRASTTSEPGSIAPLGWLKEILDYAESTISSSKLVIGIGNYGYNWMEVNNDPGEWQGTGIGYDEAMALAKEQSAPIIRLSGIDSRGYDNGPTPCFTYRDDQSRQHIVCFEDNQSLQAKLQLIKQYPTAGVIFWSVDLGDKSFWQQGQP